MKKIITALTTVLSLCAALTFAGCGNGGGTDMNKTRHNQEPVQQEQNTRENDECPDGDCKDDSSADECPDGECPEKECPDGDSKDGKRPARRDGKRPRIPHAGRRGHRHHPRPLPCPIEDN